MKIFKFLSWWWNQLYGHQRFAIIIVSLFLLVIPSVFIFGIVAVKAFLILCFASSVIGLIYIMFKYFESKWIEYKEEEELEVQKILDKLKGTSGARAVEIVEKLRARRGIQP